MRVGSGVILFQLAGFLTSALADFYFAKHNSGYRKASESPSDHRLMFTFLTTIPVLYIKKDSAVLCEVLSMDLIKFS